MQAPGEESDLPSVTESEGEQPFSYTAQSISAQSRLQKWREMERPRRLHEKIQGGVAQTDKEKKRWTTEIWQSQGSTKSKTPVGRPLWTHLFCCVRNVEFSWWLNWMSVLYLQKRNPQAPTRHERSQFTNFLNTFWILNNFPEAIRIYDEFFCFQEKFTKPWSVLGGCP